MGNFDGSSGASRAGCLALGAAGGRAEEGGLGTGGVVPPEDQDGGRFSLGGTDGRVEQQDRIDFCVPKYARDSFNLPPSSVESGFLVDGVVGSDGLPIQI